MSSEYGLTFQDTLEYAMVPSLDTPPPGGEPNGLLALITSGSLAMLAVAWFTAAASAEIVPLVAWKTIWPE